MYYNSSTAKQQDDKEAGYYYGVCLAISDLMHVCAILACFSNLNKDITIRRRVMEAIIVIFVAGEVVLLGFQPEVKIADGGNIMFVLAFLLFSGMLLVLKVSQ
jgi:K+ transporter